MTAFEIMHDELAALGAPEALLARVERARCDELCHADAMQRWATRFGHDVPEPAHASGGLRTVLAIARENAVEGCVRELFGALVVRFQAERTSLPGLREDLSRVADDEAAHASLAFDVASWLEPQLAREERASIDADVARALAELADELTEPSPELLALCGLPTRKESSALLAQMARALSTLRMTHSAERAGDCWLSKPLGCGQTRAVEPRASPGRVAARKAIASAFSLKAWTGRTSSARPSTAK